MNVLGRACVSGRARCERSHFAIPSHLPPGTCQAIAQRVWAHYEQGDFDQAESLAHILIRAVVERTEIRWSMYAQMLLATVYMAKDRTREASRIYQEVIGVARDYRDLYGEELIEAIWGYSLCLFDLGDRSKFQEMVQYFSELPSRDCECYFNIRRGILFGLRDFQTGRTTQALLAFENIARYRIVAPHFYVVSLLAIAEISIQQGDEKTAQSYLEVIDQVVMKWGYKGALLAWQHRFAGVIRLAEDFGYEWPASPMPLTYLGEVTQRALPQAEIQLHALGEGGLHLFRQRIQDWPRSPGNRMLFTFLASNPRGVTVEQIRTFLWPAAPNAASIHTAVKKLRDLVGSETVLQQNGVYRLNGAVWFDVTEYQLLYTKARQKPLDERIYDYRQAVSLYKGDFLQGVENLWVVEERARFRNMQAWLLWTLAAIYDRDEQRIEAMQFLDMALQVNPIFDPAVEHKMRLLERMDERSEAVAVFRRYEQRIQSQLGIAPSPKIINLVKRWESAPELMVTAPFSDDALLRSSRVPTAAPQHYYLQHPGEAQG